MYFFRILEDTEVPPVWDDVCKYMTVPDRTNKYSIVYDFDTLDIKYRFQPFDVEITHMTIISGDINYVVCCGMNKRLLIFDLDKEAIVHNFKLQVDVVFLTSCKDLEAIAIALDTCQVRIFSLRTMDFMERDIPQLNSKISHICLTEESLTFSSLEGKLVKYLLLNSKSSNISHREGITYFTHNAFRNAYIICNHSNYVWIKHSRTGKTLVKIRVSNGVINFADMSADGQHLIFSHSGNKLEVYDVGKNQHILSQNMYSLVTSLGILDNFIIATTRQGYLSVFSIYNGNENNEKGNIYDELSVDIQGNIGARHSMFRKRFTNLVNTRRFECKISLIKNEYKRMSSRKKRVYPSDLDVSNGQSSRMCIVI